jgi:uncharacterized protein with NAD-binding domain and iron-sulfur cluster
VKRRIAVLGGGPAALTAVHELTRRPGWRDRYDITVYQMGHRLGGKGASGVNRAHHDRIEEHGLHIFWGFYENAFRMMRELYAELGRPDGAPLATVEEAFFPHDTITMPQPRADGRPDYWPMRARRNERTPGDGLDDVLEPWDYVPRLLGQALEALGVGAETRVDGGALARVRPFVEAALARGGEAVEALDRAFGGLARTLFASLVQGSRLARSMLPLAGGIAVARALAEAGDERREERARSVLYLVRHLSRSFDQLIEGGDTDAPLRIQIDLALCLLRGLIVDGLAVPPRDFHALDDESFRDWLARHGARRETVDSTLLSGLLVALYANGLDIGAGTGLHGLLRIAFTYKGAILWKMRAGMGETIFGPMYEVLRRRGVRFAFFHAVDHLELSEDRRRVARVVMDVQARPAAGAYRPLVDVRGLPVWPSEPLWDQLEDGAALRAAGVDFEDWWSAHPPLERRVLEDGRDFDEVILGISLGALGEVCAELCADPGNPRFGAMVAGVRTTMTQSATVWMTSSLDRLGWPGAEPPVVVPYAPPLDAWADMAHLIAREDWPAHARPGSCAYLTGRLDHDEPVPPRGPSDYPARVRAQIKRNTAAWLREHGGALWPGAADTDDPCALQWHRLVDDEDRDGEARLDAQWIAPIPNPSNRYVLSLPGTTRYRLRSGESGYENLVLAGDWTRNAINGGCFEGAVMSGQDAARALDPAVREGIGDWLGKLEKARRPAASPPAPPLAERPPLPRSLTTRPAAPEAPAPLRALPRYVARDGELLAVPPIQLEVDVTMFALRADPACLTALLDQHLNLGGGEVVYRPLAPLAVLYFAHVDNYPVPDPLGYVPELDFGLWVPALGGRLVGGRFVADRVVTFTPYLWVSNDLALTNGRSVFGFYKDLGTRMTMPDEGDPGRPYAVDAWVLPRLGRGAPTEQRPLISVRHEARPERLPALNGLGHLLGTMAAAVADRPDAEAPLSSLRTGLLLAQAAPRGQRMVFLKQLPDAVDARRACYQAVVESDIRFTSEPEASLLRGRFEVEMHEYDSHHVVRTLGLAADRVVGRTHHLTPLAAGRARFGARVENPAVLWERGVPARRPAPANGGTLPGA